MNIIKSVVQTFKNWFDPYTNEINSREKAKLEFSKKELKGLSKYYVRYVKNNKSLNK